MDKWQVKWVKCQTTHVITHVTFAIFPVVTATSSLQPFALFPLCTIKFFFLNFPQQDYCCHFLTTVDPTSTPRTRRVHFAPGRFPGTPGPDLRVPGPSGHFPPASTLLDLCELQQKWILGLRLRTSRYKLVNLRQTKHVQPSTRVKSTATLP